MEYSARKEKARKEYVLEDPDSDPNSSESLLSDYDFSYNRNHKPRRCGNNKNDQKLKKHDSIKLYAKLTSKLPTTAYKSKLLQYKLDGYPL